MLTPSALCHRQPRDARALDTHAERQLRPTRCVRVRRRLKFNRKFLRFDIAQHHTFAHGYMAVQRQTLGAQRDRWRDIVHIAQCHAGQQAALELAVGKARQQGV